MWVFPSSKYPDIVNVLRCAPVWLVSGFRWPHVHALCSSTISRHKWWIIRCAAPYGVVSEIPSLAMPRGGFNFASCHSYLFVWLCLELSFCLQGCNLWSFFFYTWRVLHRAKFMSLFKERLFPLLDMCVIDGNVNAQTWVEYKSLKEAYVSFVFPCLRLFFSGKWISVRYAKFPCWFLRADHLPPRRVILGGGPLLWRIWMCPIMGKIFAQDEILTC